MVCATTKNIIMTQQSIMNQTPKQQQQEDNDFDMDEEDDSEDEVSSQDDETSAPTTKRPVTQALFLNFTSDLSPQKANKKKSKPKKQTAYRVNGVNILNRNNLDSKTAIERIQRRRENHNHVERRRRDNINNTIFELSAVVPNAIQPGQKPNKGSILKLSLEYIKDLQAENNALKERLVQCTASSRPSSISPSLSSALIPPPILNITPLTTTAALPAVDESFSSNFYHQQSPSAPNSPNRFRRNNVSTQQQHHHHRQQQQSVSVPSSPMHHMSKEDTLHMNPFTLPPPHHQHHPQQLHQQQQQQQQQQLQNVFSSMSVSSDISSASSTPVLSATVSYPSFSSTTAATKYPPLVTPSPPQYSNATFNPQQQQQHKQNLRPLLPATNPPVGHHQPPTIQQQPILPTLRMSGYEKIYGNVCRY